MIVFKLINEFFGAWLRFHLPSFLVAFGLFGFMLTYIFPAKIKPLNLLANLLAAALIWLGFKEKQDKWTV